MRRALGLLLVAGLLLVVAGCGGDDGSKDDVSPPSAADVPADFAGIVDEYSFANDGAYRERTFSSMRKAGFGIIRQTFDWSLIERSRDSYSLEYHDAYVLDAARAGLSILPILFRAPAFHAERLPADAKPNTAAPPRDPQAMARFATALARRYGSEGTLWTEHPDVPKHPITAWQVWNEPNLPVYWGGEPDAAQYVALLGPVASALHAADPRAQVVSAGLPDSKLGIPFATYLKQMYAAGAGGTFDVLAINPYSRRVAGMEAAIAGARRIMASAEQGDVPIWVTEFGWATRPTSPKSPLTVGPKTQSRLITQAVRMLQDGRERLGLRGFVYYGWRDAPPYPGGEDFWGLHTGLRDLDGAPKPSFAAVSKLNAEAVR